LPFVVLALVLLALVLLALVLLALVLLSALVLLADVSSWPPSAKPILVDQPLSVPPADDFPSYRGLRGRGYQGQHSELRR
jgi:hypothetical protein